MVYIRVSNFVFGVNTGLIVVSPPPQAEFREKLDEVQRQKEEHLENVKAQSSYFIEKKTAELDKFVKEYGTYRADVEGKLAKSTETNAYLLTYARKLAAIVEKVESGAYPVRDRQVRNPKP